MKDWRRSCAKSRLIGGSISQLRALAYGHVAHFVGAWAEDDTRARPLAWPDIEKPSEAKQGSTGGFALMTRGPRSIALAARTTWAQRGFFVFCGGGEHRGPDANTDYSGHRHLRRPGSYRLRGNPRGAATAYGGNLANSLDISPHAGVKVVSAAEPMGDPILRRPAGSGHCDPGIRARRT